MSIYRAFSINSVAVVIKMSTLLILNKAIAILIGPSGYATISQLQNIVAISLTSATAGLGGAAVKYTAEADKSDKYLTYILLVCVLSSLLTSALLIFFAKKLAADFDGQIEWFIYLLSFTLIFYVINTLATSYLNGLQKLRLLVGVNIISSIFSLLYSLLFLYLWKLQGILIAVVSNQAITVFIVIYFCKKKELFPKFRINYIVQKFEFDIVKKLLFFSLMVVIPSIIWPYTYINVRDLLTDKFGSHYAGNWDASWRLSTIYLTFITSVLSIYFLPKFAKCEDKKSLNSAVLEGLKFIFPVALVSCSAIYLSRDIIINLLFSDEFNDMKQLFFWQVCGDFFKVVTWVVSYTLLAKAQTFRHIFVEVFFALSFYFFTFHFISTMGFGGVAFSHFINNALMMLVIAFIYRISKFKEA
ncbi:O-antigen translocase [Paraglaciecola sp.]|uniref:O-antigen translocase n=1 Tax=Paraglaciecola sp. TaxID=1920173 RepID=UPI00273E3E73|nr:O-antigen translocase [Paraglaciecola sp.]MDP5030882.1 O-antigen translocase [Paraglaciecola sp.]